MHGGSSRQSGVWKGILSVLEPFIQSIRFHVGKGDRVRFWLDIWIGDSPLATQFLNLFHCAQNGRALANDYIKRLGGKAMWGPIFRGNLSEEEERRFCSPLTLIGGVYYPMDGRDSQVWSHSTYGPFSVASFFHAFNMNDSNASHISRLWKIKAPPRVLAFAWIVLQGGTLTMDIPGRRNMVIVNACPMCLKNAESMDHLFLNCRVAQGLWNDVYSWFDMRGVLPIFPSSLRFGC